MVKRKTTILLLSARKYFQIYINLNVILCNSLSIIFLTNILILINILKRGQFGRLRGGSSDESASSSSSPTKCQNLTVYNLTPTPIYTHLYTHTSK